MIEEQGLMIDEFFDSECLILAADVNIQLQSSRLVSVRVFVQIRNAGRCPRG
jgi:hypothetical protein